MKIALSGKQVLAHDLTIQQASNLIDKIRERNELFKEDQIWLASQKDSDKWYVYVVNVPMVLDFIQNPDKYTFEV